MLPFLLLRDPQDEIHNHRRQQRDGQHRGPQAIVEATLTPQPDALRAPVERDKRIYHGAHGDEGEEAGADLAHAVAEVEEADGETAEDDGEVEPGEESAFVGEEDFGLDAGGEGYAFSCGSC